MKLRSKVLKGSALLGAGQITAYGAGFVRNMIVARALTKSNYGIAAALSLTISAFEISSKMSIGQQIVQSKEGDHENFQATAQLCQFGAGFIGAALLATFGGPMADLFKVPQARWAFLLLAVTGILNGLQHLDAMRCMRGLHFAKRVTVDVIPELVLAAAAYPLVLWLKDYRAVVILLLGRSIMLLVLSHWVAERPYRWKFSRQYFSAILVFSWPLLLNAFLIFGYQQGDQILIGAHFSMAALAQYSLAVSVTMIPGYMFQYVVTSIMLPLLSQAQDDPVQYRRRYLFCAEMSTVAGVLIACFLILGGELVIVTAFGKKYAGSSAIVAWLAVANALRIIRAVPTLAGMARGDTINNMLANFFRISSLALAGLAILSGKSILWIAACGVFGEVAALTASWRRLSRKCGIPVKVGLRSTTVAVVIIALCSAVAFGLNAYVSNAVVVLLCVGGCLTAFVVMWRLFAEFRRHALETLRQAPAAGFLVRVLTWCASV